MKKEVVKILLLLMSCTIASQAWAVGEHWTWNPQDFPFNATFVGVISIDGIEQRSDQLEIGAFDGENCRGAIKCVYEQRKDRYFAYLTINGEIGTSLHFRLWDHATDMEVNASCDLDYIFHPDDHFGLPSNPYVFTFTTNSSGKIFTGEVSDEWSNPDNWQGGELPTVMDDVVIIAPCVLDQDASIVSVSIADNMSLTIPTGMILMTTTIDSDAPSKLVVASGGQLMCNNMEGVFATIQKDIAGYGDGNGNWQFIASPLVANSLHTEVENLVNPDGFDLFAFDQSEELEWRTFKGSALTLNPTEGYLYANNTDVTLGFVGELNSSENEVTLDFSPSFSQAGWNLIGNPFTYNVFIDRSYYVMNPEGTALNPVAASLEEEIAPCTGVMVHADSYGQAVHFSSTNSNATNKGIIQMTVQSLERGNEADRAIVSFNPADGLTKFVFNRQLLNVFIPQDGADYAIATADANGEVPVNLSIAHSGRYTLGIQVADIELDYLHLVDNMTGADIDLLENPNYNFEARLGDYASRFRLIFKSKTDAIEDRFAYYDGSEWIIVNDGEAVVQLVDVFGRIVKQETINSTVSMQIPNTYGMYVIRLVQNNNTKTQKILPQ